MDQYREKFQGLLRELFQFDCADLDFGIYRIMNYKRDVIEKFISTDLPKAIADELDRGVLADQSQAAKELVEVAKQITESLGKDALDADGRLAEAYHSTPLGKKYLDLKGKAAGGRGRQALEATIFNHLHTFFSRYYQDGDFISKRRYSKRQRYAIPYNGEEVYLHWANHDQYYVKTAENFHDYSFTSRGVTVHFKIKAANVEQNNVKGDTRFFIPRVKEIDWDDKASQLVIPFEYRPLTDQEAVTYGTKNQQDKIIADAVDSIPKRLKKADKALLAVAVERHKNSDGQPVSFLEHHLRQYTRRNTSDFFIHKDLKGFLCGELDFYLKNEVLNLDEMETAGEDRSEGWFQVMRVIKAVGSRIIDFLEQIESFQKMLWEKRKFITETQYCITVGTIDGSFYPEIADCDAQWAEWKDLFHIDEEQSDLFSNGKSKKDRRIAFLKAHPTLVLDTKCLSQALTDRLLGSFEALDAVLDGVLIHSENFQALTMLLDSLRGKVECVYIDPPYNTGDSEILYKNEYLRSSWLSLMQNRLAVAMRLLTDDPVVFIAIDDFEMVDLAELIDKHFPFLRREMIIVNHHPQGGKAKVLANTHEYMLACVRQDSDRTLSGRMSKDGVELRPFKRSGTAESNFRYGRPNSFYAVLVDPDTKAVVGIEPPPDRNVHDYPTGKTKEGFLRVFPLSGQPNDPPDRRERVWRRSYESCQNLVDRKQLQCSDNLTIYQLIEAQDRTAALFSNWVDPRYNAGTFGANLLGDIIGEHNPFSYPKSVHTVGDAIFAAGVEDDAYCVDFFGGSGTTGHAVINLNREDGGNRKFIMAEMGRYFDTVLLPRIKKVTFAPEWKDGKPKRLATAEEAERSPRIVKYVRLESYEDALGSIRFDDASGQGALKFDDYLLKYMLKWEARKSETLLNVEKLARPFAYKLTVMEDGESVDRTVDVPETFNYLLGLHVSTRKVYDDGGRRYLVYRGRIDHRQIAVIWRDTDAWQKKDLERDKKFVADQKLTEGADEVFVNGDSFIPNARALEPVFKARMFSTVEA
ncbi:MAG: site-specific DNA-methyltransferase [Verrucomicrobia bacterium]|nr:site-specific DNA-methyltransferase [Verrucomicrobiota bacterium]HPV12309.1 DNA methyltransferase [Verrucomicrobiota bacterium]HQI31557.1 DNA methyltransferase [Verrucomicrobiota bacterium]HRD03258.1 DNA methyltransferase [Verrucomicrobiota bacterium]